MTEVPLCFHGLGAVPDNMLGMLFAEFAAQGVTRMGFASGWCERILSEDDFLEKILNVYKKFGMTPAGTHGPWGPGWDITETNLERRPILIEAHKKLLEIMGGLGVKTYTVHPHAGFNPDLRQDELMRNNAIETLTALLPVAEKANIVIAIENNFTPPCTGERIVDLITYFNSPFIGANYDSGHAHILDPAPGKKFSDISPRDYWKLYPQEFQQHQLETMLPYLVTCHLHDNDGLGDSHLPPGQGTIDWKKTMAMISSAPHLLEYQCEVNIMRSEIAISTLCKMFNPDFLAGR